MELPMGLRVIKSRWVSFPIPLLDLLTYPLSYGKPLCASRSEARRLVRSRAVYVGDTLQEDELGSVSIESREAVIRIGYRRVIFRPNHFLLFDECEWESDQAQQNWRKSIREQKGHANEDN